MKECAISLALAAALISGVPSLSWERHAEALTSPVLPDLAVLISGPPIKDPEALLRYALPIDNKAIREVQKPLEDITESLRVAGLKALDSVERVRIKTLFLFLTINLFSYLVLMIDCMVLCDCRT